MDFELTWDNSSADPEGDCERTARRLAQLEAILGQLTTGVAILEPVHDGDHPSLRVAMINDVAACYFGRLGERTDRLADAEAGFRLSGLLDLALMVSLTGQEHMHEALPAPGPAAAGSMVDLVMTPLGCGTVTITFVDVTQRVRTSGT